MTGAQKFVRLGFRREGGRWSIVSRSAPSDAAPPAPHLSKDAGAYFFGEEGRHLDPIAKELAADALQHRPSLFAALGSAARSCREAATGQFELDVRENDLGDFERLFDGRFGGTAPPPVRSRDRLRFLESSLIAFAILTWSLVRFAGSGGGTGAQGGTMLAAHGEWTNRTRHLFEIARREESTFQLLLLGRPKLGDRAILRLLQDKAEGLNLRLVRPYSLPALARCAPALPRRLAQAFGAMRRTGHFPPRGRLAGILYRTLLGEVHRAWWAGSRLRPGLVVYAHTGLADTSALEEAQQRSGTRTVHLFHGISTGHAFTGFSDLALTRCRHDAEWHRQLGGYGSAASIEAPPPSPSAGGEDWALFTNYAHPTAFASHRQGIAAEKEALRLVSGALRRMERPPRRLLYRPHPALAMLGEEARSDVLRIAGELGLDPWPEDRAPGDFGGLELVLATPSTIVQDALRAGLVPILLDLAGADSDSLYGSYPFLVRSEAELERVAEAVRSEGSGAFRRAWDHTGPGALPDLRQLQEFGAPALA